MLTAAKKSDTRAFANTETVTGSNNKLYFLMITD
jgi:hypothetical protein